MTWTRQQGLVPYIGFENVCKELCAYHSASRTLTLSAYVRISKCYLPGYKRPGYKRNSDIREIVSGIKSDDQDFDEDDDAESVSSEVSESDKPAPNSLAALNALETLTANFEAKSSNPDGALKMIYGLYESVHDVNKEIFVQ